MPVFKIKQNGEDGSNGTNFLSGDVDPASKGIFAAAAQSQAVSLESSSKKVSLKIMTLNNSRQKINDCLGNPVEIGIAVMWRVVDTAKAVFEVDNYKAFLSLQCDSALRNIVRLYPYDVAPGIDTTGEEFLSPIEDDALPELEELLRTRFR